jgi:hypothetical protein
MGAVLSIRRNIPCPDSCGICVVFRGICVVVPHGLVVVSDYKAKQLHLYSLIDGTRIRSIGSKGSGKGQFDFGYGGLCVSPDGDSVLMAERCNNRVQEVRITDGSWVRFAGEGVLKGPEHVDCNADVIVASEWGCHRISVLSWADGSVRAQIGDVGCESGQLLYPRGVRLLTAGNGVVVADSHNHRLCVFALSGEFVAAVGSEEQGLSFPRDVLERVSDGSLIVASCSNVVRLRRDGVKFKEFGKYGGGNGRSINPIALAALPNDGCFVANSGNQPVQQLSDLQAKLTWMRACASSIV